ncbi:hypothetical protein K503DRAFT_826874, partial [Rhizopogon vinicolor AM-OR11-026]
MASSQLIRNSGRYLNFHESSVEVYFREIIYLSGSDAYPVVKTTFLIVARTATKSNTPRY